MMQKILFLLMALFSFVACTDNDEGRFDVPVSFRKDISFRPIPGGAVMKYYLPENAEIFGLRVCYTDAQGEKVQKEGTYLNDSLVLLGFNEKQEHVPARVTFFNNKMEESEPLELSFQTEPSATVAFFDNLEVNSYWGGFSMIYTSPEMVSGMVHILYLGTNPLTQQPDTIWVMSTPILEGGDTLNFVLKQVKESNTVVVRTEDYRGYRVKQQIFDGLPALYMDTLSSNEFDFRFTGEIIEKEEYALGKQYLFDGDKNGKVYRRFVNSGVQYKYGTFVAGPNAFGERFIVDLRKERIPAAVRLYAFLKYSTIWPTRELNPNAPGFLIDMWDGSYRSKLPCKVKLYGTNDNPETVNLASCVLLNDFSESPLNSDFQNVWSFRTDDLFSLSKVPSMQAATEAEIDAAEPVYMEMLCNYSGQGYRYLIFVVEDTFDGNKDFGLSTAINAEQYITFNELEICVKKD